MSKTAVGLDDERELFRHGEDDVADVDAVARREEAAAVLALSGGRARERDAGALAEVAEPRLERGARARGVVVLHRSDFRGRRNARRNTKTMAGPHWPCT